MKNGEAEAKICESCGEKFDCGSKNNSCWCFKVEIPPANLAQLKVQFKHCLCPQCLKSFSAHAETASISK